MKVFDSFFASSYNFYARFKNEAPHFSSIVIIGVIQTLLVFLILSALKKANIFCFPETTSSVPRLFVVPVLIIWCFILKRYYTKERVELILKKMEAKSPEAKRMWNILTLVALILPMVLICLLLKK